MKLTIFCLLAFCAFKIVHAYNLQNQLMSVFYDSETQITRYLAPKRKKVQGLLDAAKGKKKSSCQSSFDDAVKKVAIRQQVSFNKCVYDASVKSDFQTGQACFSADVLSIKSAVDTLISQTKKCLGVK